MLMGVVYIPRTGEMFHAEKGKGAYLNGKRIKVSSRSFNNAVMCTALPVYHKEYAEVCSRIILEAFGKCNDIRRFGACAPELCYLAMGRCELYFEYLLSPWDYAAASLIITEAGGIISSIDGSAAFRSDCGKQRRKLQRVAWDCEKQIIEYYYGQDRQRPDGMGGA